MMLLSGCQAWLQPLPPQDVPTVSRAAILETETGRRESLVVPRPPTPSPHSSNDFLSIGSTIATSTSQTASQPTTKNPNPAASVNSEHQRTVPSDRPDNSTATVATESGPATNTPTVSEEEARPLDLDRLVALARERHPSLAAARLDVEAARGRLIQAGLYPNPVVGYEAEDLAERGGAGKHGPIVGQEIVLGGKLRLAQQVATSDLLAADWQAVAQWYDLVTEIRLAWVELLAAEGEFRIFQNYVRLIGDQKGGLLQMARRLAQVEGFRWELLRAEIEYQTAQTRLEGARRRLEAARKKLAAVVGVSSLSGPVPAEQLHGEVPQYHWEKTLQATLERSAALKQAQAQIQRAERHWQLVAAQNIPNLRVLFRPGYSFNDDSATLRVEGGIMLPLFDRQQGNLLAARAELARQIQLAETVRLDVTRRLADAYGRYTAAYQQAQNYTAYILPRAEESLKVMRTLFERAKAEELRTAFLGLLEAYRAWLDAQLGYLQARRDLWLAVYEIAGLLQQDRLESLP